MRIDKDLVAASATPFVRGILADGDLYGHAILERVGELSGGSLQWTDGMLYPLLHRLERLGCVQRRQGISPADVDELEDHLRAQVADLRATGLDDDEAFLVRSSAWAPSTRSRTSSPGSTTSGCRSSSCSSRRTPS